MYELKDKEMIFVFTGPTGAGRKTIAELAGATIPMKQVISYTTREPRANEAEGRDYHFIGADEFQSAMRNDEFVETVEIDGVHYGIKSADVEAGLRQYGCIYLVLNRYGADILKKLYGDKVKRFFIYASPDTIVSRLVERGDSRDRIDRYVSHYDEEMEYRGECEHAYENLDSSRTIYDVAKELENYLQRGLLELD
ncbi:guanylate kinase [Paenibacillus hemerocallicola]|uniref:Guanylate kinase n=1 Tax=Paenibacillus hemerocallicola TaxID=1172614 RepID=A0A5C4T5Q4_9BACL|nr:guanylate kinase [Paenibacillus hemerocallicola]TNJ64105.1 guanylate kinase [Paenibacillus hemerocallicola]